MTHYGYSRLDTVKVTRRTHKITVRCGHTAKFLADALKQVPDGAQITELYFNDDDESHTFITIEFVEETKE